MYPGDIPHWLPDIASVLPVESNGAASNDGLPEVKANIATMIHPAQKSR